MGIKKRGLIMYASVTGNTEKVAKAFEEAFQLCGWECDLLKLDGSTNLKKNPIFFSDYDIVALGSPVMAGLPDTNLGRVLGLTQPQPPRMWPDDPNFGDDSIPVSKEPADTDAVKGIVFCTYAGAIREAYSTLAVEKQYLECLRLKIVGEFSCPGGEISHMAVDKVAAIMNVAVDKAAPLVQKYKADPGDILFSKLTAQQHEEMKAAVADPRDMPDYEGMQGFINPKWDLENRPDDRDMTMARIFMQNIIQDFFFGRTRPQDSYGEYLCIG